MATNLTEEQQDKVFRLLEAERRGLLEDKPDLQNRLNEMRNRGMVEEPEEGMSTATKIRSAEPSAIMTGSLIGGVLGAPAGPVGIAVGGALGAAAGKQAQTVLESVSRFFGVEGLGAQPPLTTQIEGAVREGIYDLGFSSVGKLAGNAFDALMARGRNNGLKLGFTEEGKQFAKELDRLGVEPRLINTSNSPAIRFYSKVIARFPFAAGPFRKASTEALQQTEAAAGNLFNSVGPSWDMAKLGIKMDNAYSTQYSWFRRKVNRLYTGAINAAKNANVQIDMTETKAVAQKILSDRATTMKVQGMSDKAIKKALKKGALGRVSKYANLADVVDIDAYRLMSEELERDLKWAASPSRGGSDVGTFGVMKDAFDRSFDTMDNQQVLRQFKEADKVFFDTMTEIFETPSGQKTLRVAKDRFKVGKPTKQGPTAPDASYTLLFEQAKSPQELMGLRKAVGQERFAAATRRYIETAWNKANRLGSDAAEVGEKSVGFDFDSFKRSLGIGDPDSLQYLKTQASLAASGSKTTMKDLEVLTEALETTLRNVPDDVNTFIARRATLAGPKAVVGALGAGTGGAVLGGPAGAASGIGALVVTRNLGRFLSRKRYAEIAKEILDPSLTFTKRRAKIILLDKMIRDDYGEPILAEDERQMLFNLGKSPQPNVSAGRNR